MRAMEMRQNTCGSGNYRRGNPDPDRFAGERPQAAGREEADTYWRHLNRPPGKEIAVATERGEKGDAAAAVGQRVQEAM